MKLREHMNTVEDGYEFTCWDSVIDSEFYLYKEDEDFEADSEFPNVDNLMEYLKDNLEVKEIHKNGVEVGLYDLLNHPVIIEYAKEHLYEKNRYSSDEQVVMLLFEAMESNISNGYENFSGKMLEAFHLAYPEEKTLHQAAANDMDAILVERDYKGEKERFALTPDEFKEHFPQVVNYAGWPLEKSDSFTLRPLVHIWYSPCKIGDDLWNEFFTDMQWGLSEGDLQDGYEAYIREDFMGKLKNHLLETITQPENNNLRKVYILTCTHKTRYGVDTYSSAHASRDEAFDYIDAVKEECAFGEYGEDEYFDYYIKVSNIDISKLLPVNEIAASIENTAPEAKEKTVLYGLSVVSSEGYMNGNESIVTLYQSYEECVTAAFNLYENYWFEHLGSFDALDSNGNDILSEEAFEKTFLKDPVVIQFDDYHIQFECFSQELELTRKHNISLDNKLSVKTPIGDIVVQVKTDSEYPGVYIDLKGDKVNDTFEVETVMLGTVEYEPSKKAVQTLVYGDAEREEPTHIVKHENVEKTNSLEEELSEAKGRTEKESAKNVKEVDRDLSL